MSLRSPCMKCERSNEDKSQDACVECEPRKAYAKLDDRRGILTTFQLEGIVRPIKPEERQMIKPANVTKKVFHPEPVCLTCGIFPQTISKKGQRTGFCAGCLKKRMVALQARKSNNQMIEESIRDRKPMDLSSKYPPDFPDELKHEAAVREVVKAELKQPNTPVSHFLEIICPKCKEKHSVIVVVGE